MIKNTNSAPTIKDVAREAGVALGTVSKVINGIPVGESYRIRVEEAIEKLNYRINSYAKGLKSNRTFVVAVMVPNLISPFFAKLVNCLNKSLAQRSYRMLLLATDYDPEQEQSYVFMAAEQQKVDGIICLSYNPKLQVPEDVPFVSIDRHIGAHIPCVASDNYGGGALAAEVLVRNGCKNLAFLRIGSKLTNEPNKRRDGFINACENMDVPYTLKIVDDGTPYTAFEDFLQEHLREGKLNFDGIFCVTDNLASQIIGYTGAIPSRAMWLTLQAKGYSYNDTIGRDGIESSMEDWLTQNSSLRKGSRVVERDQMSKVVRELSYTEPQDGNNVQRNDQNQDQKPVPVPVQHMLLCDRRGIHGSFHYRFLRLE
jgi:LacI family transcriptional regulator